jgi:hypothetical protein
MLKSVALKCLIFLSVILFAINGCGKSDSKEPPKVVSYKIKLITGPATYIRYSYNDLGLLSYVDGVDRDKSITAFIYYEGETVRIDYRNRTADEIWNIVMKVDTDKGYILEYDDGIYTASFKYDSVVFADGVKRLVSSAYTGGRYEGDSLFYSVVYDNDGTLLQCSHRGETRIFEYYKDQEYDAIINTNFPEAALGRFERIIGYLPYTFGPPQKYLVKRQLTPGLYDIRYSYVKDEFNRVDKVVVNGVSTAYEYLDE